MHPVPLTGLETKFHAFSVDTPVTATGMIEGHAAVFGEPDQGGDVIRPGAFLASLRARRPRGSIKMLWQHDPARPIGVWEEIREDGTGLHVKGRLLTDIAQGAEAATLLSAGALDGLSIGYRTVKAEKDQGSGHRILTEIDLWEVSLVTFPMMPGARISGPDNGAAALAAMLTDARDALRI